MKPSNIEGLGAQVDSLVTVFDGDEAEALAWLSEDDAPDFGIFNDEDTREAVVFDYGYLRGVADCFGMTAAEVAQVALEARRK